jgi:phage terminase large subunit-like protein
MHSSTETIKPLKRSLYDSTTVNGLTNVKAADAAANFWAFRQYVHPDFKSWWWNLEVAMALQKFWYDFKAGKRPKLVLAAPPQHGKSMSITDFIAWCAGRDPNLRFIFASYSDKLGEKANKDIQRVIDGERYPEVFLSTQLSQTANTVFEGRYKRNSELLEFVDAKGSFTNTTVDGQITGFGLDLGFIDDPIKGRQEASSKANRDKVWNWLTDDFFSRFSDEAGFVMIATRWHLDDPTGRWLEKFPNTKVLRYPAIATEDSGAYKRTPLDREMRKIGDPLFPVHKSLEFLMERKKLYTIGSWESIYQQNPIVVGGGIFPIEKLRVIPVFDRNEIMMSIRAWDKAGTEEGEGAYTAGVLMHWMRNKTYVIENIVRGRWGALQREEVIKSTAQSDRAALKHIDYKVIVEQASFSIADKVTRSTIAGRAARQKRPKDYRSPTTLWSAPFSGSLAQAPFLAQREAVVNDRCRN